MFIPTAIQVASPVLIFSGCKVYANATQNINNTLAAANFNLEEYDTDGFHDNVTNNSRVTIPTGKSGKYLISGGTFCSAGSDFIGFRLNGSTSIRGYQTALTGGANYRSAQTTVDLAVDDYVELIISTQNNINIGHATLPDAQSWLSVTLLGGAPAQQSGGSVSPDDANLVFGLEVYS